MKILKFGGSSIQSPERIENVIKIINNTLLENQITAIIFSALGGITDKLIKLSVLAAGGDKNYANLLNEIKEIHMNVVKTLIKSKHKASVLEKISAVLNELSEIIHGIYMVKDIAYRTQDFIMSFGEILSAYIIYEILTSRNIEAEFLDSRQLIKTDSHFGNAHIIFDETNKKIRNYFSSHKKLQIVTGFIGSTKNDETTTLGRGGSDYTASIIGAALNASEIEIWTDVDGVMTADPRKVKKTFSIEHLSYEEAMEMSHFGAKVIYPSAMQPTMEKKIPICIKNTFNLSFKGTVISDKKERVKFLIKGISSITDIALLRIQGSGMVGVSGIAGRLFNALARYNINIILITQASSEHSICVAIMPQFIDQAKAIIQEEFKLELTAHWIDKIIVENELSIIAIVGENMRHTPGIAGRMFQALGKNGVNVVAIAQGSSELNISAVIRKTDEAKALNALHDAFFLSETKSINLFLVGVGLIGTTLMNQIKSHLEYLKNKQLLDIRIIGLADIDKMVFNSAGIDIFHWKDLFSSSTEKTDMKEFVNNMITLNLSNSIFIDCTASDEVVSYYDKIIDSSISIVTPNKRASSGSLKNYKYLKELTQKRGIKFLYETNVGAGLPVISTLNDLLISGDKIYKIEAILSGSLSFIFNNLNENRKFSEVVLEAREKGYTEPDPRDDLSGLDVARKILILARETGKELELDDIQVENLVPENCRDAESIEDFFSELKKADHLFLEKQNLVYQKGKVLRYIASLENGKISVRLQAIGPEHPFYSLSGSDNIISFTTQRYTDRPLVIKGPGAGAEVTAAGVFADIIRIASYLSNI
jgi:aspartokinase/homoserine dehydrogenase 1